MKEYALLEDILIKQNPALLASTLSESEYEVFSALLRSKHALTAKGIQREIGLKKILAVNRDPYGTFKRLSVNELIREVREQKLGLPSDYSIRNALERLVTLGLVEIELRPKENKREKTNQAYALYYVNLKVRSLGLKLD